MLINAKTKEIIKSVQEDYVPPVIQPVQEITSDTSQVKQIPENKISSKIDEMISKKIEEIINKKIEEALNKL